MAVPKDARGYVTSLIPISNVVEDLSRHAGDLRREMRSEPSLHDVLWRYLNHSYLDHCQRNQFGLATGDLFSMACVLDVEQSFDKALRQECRGVYLTESGIASASGRNPRATLEYGGATLGLLGKLEDRAVAALIQTREALAPIFIDAVRLDAYAMQHLKPIGGPAEVWARIGSQVFEG